MMVVPLVSPRPDASAAMSRSVSALRPRATGATTSTSPRSSGRRAALAVDNARLYRASQEARIGGGEGQPRQGRVPGHPLPRAAHAAHAHPGLDGDAALRHPRPGRRSCAGWRSSSATCAPRPSSSATSSTSRASSPASCASRCSRIDLAPVVEAGVDAVRLVRGGQGDHARRSSFPRRCRTVTGRSRPPAAGGVEPRLQRRQVHARRAAASRCGCAQRGLQPQLSRARHRQGHRVRSSCPTCSTASARRTAPARARTAGSGLGLAIVRHLVELHGGTVHAESEGDGHGRDLHGPPALWRRPEPEPTAPAGGAEARGSPRCASTA